MPISRTPRPDPRSVRWLSGVMAALYAATCALVIYFRLGPVSRVLARVERDGARVPAWMPAAFTVGAVVAAAFLAWKGAVYLRRALGPRTGPPAR